MPTNWNNRGWIGVDLDATLAYYEPGSGVETIGKPIPKMVKRVKNWLAQGIQVKIVTARANPDTGLALQAKVMIEKWCLKHIG